MFSLPILQCLCCTTMFITPNISYWDNEVEEICPMPGCEATELDFEVVSDEEIDEFFWDAVQTSFSPPRRNNLNKLVADTMAPYNPLSRLL